MYFSAFFFIYLLGEWRTEGFRVSESKMEDGGRRRVRVGVTEFGCCSALLTKKSPGLQRLGIRNFV